MKAQVLLPKIFNFSFTYETKKEKLTPGDIVEVPFGKEKAIGVVWPDKSFPPKDIKIKNIHKKIGKISLNKNFINFMKWFAMYNVTPLGLVLKMVIGGNKNLFIKNDKNFDLRIIEAKKFYLNQEQKNALKFLNSKNNKFDVSVLQGTTGSGKTLVYFERIKKIIAENKQALVLLPEIFLTNEFKTRFYDFFGFEPAIWHSKITPKNKRIIWNGIINNNIKLVVGARSSLLLPFKKLGVIIVDEEHDTSYKQDEGVIYHARDMAIVRASFEKIPIHLVTSIPSLETFNNIQNKKFRHFKIYKRYADYPLPKTKIVNLNLKKIKNSFVSDESIEIVKRFLEKGEQVLFFLNRRGYAPYLICKKCGYKHICSNCSLYLTFHKIKNKAICHHCSLEKVIENKCKLDGKCDFIMYGPGVEKIAEEVKLLFPDKKVIIFSSDTMNKASGKNILIKIISGEAHILVGTQLISKGFHFPNLNCIIVLDIDLTSQGHDLRSTEKNLQLYHQLSGRAGRAGSLGANRLISRITITVNQLFLDLSDSSRKDW